MYFHKITPSINFRYNSKDGSLLTQSDEISTELNDLGDNVYQYKVSRDGWSQKSQAPLQLDAFKHKASHGHLKIDNGSLECDLDGVTLLKSEAEKSFGVCGKKWIFNFDYNEEMTFYGLGEKNHGFEKTGIKTKFWNTDVWGDYHMHAVKYGTTECMYISIPYLLIKQKQGCVGILLNNPYASFMDIASHERIGQLQDTDEVIPPKISIGSSDGTPELFFVIGKNVQEVTSRFQKLCGTTPLPPLWALGNHQCRFGYESLADLEELDKKFDQHDIPCDGLWLDIDYMEHFKVFTYDEEKFKDRTKRINKLQDKGRKVVPIFDPGVKQEQGYHAYDSGLENDIFCKTPEGHPYTGYVWPGRTAFPDYSLEKGREWWAKKVQEFVQDEIYGAWLDMNDPSVGSAELDEMLFDDGKDSHESYHNQYALGMQVASRKGFLDAHPNKRTFLLSRSAYTGSSQFSAVWTGDNYSNTHNLKGSIPLSLNLSLSGIPFNGPDVPGFGGDASGEMAVAWHKAGFLFPFFRNHSEKNVTKQEPWVFEKEVTEVIQHYIQLRYKLLPYLYNTFIEQEQKGHPILRPMFYEFENSDSQNWDRTEDQFFTGHAILQAPVLDENENTRILSLPEDCSWYSALDAKWINGKSDIEVKTSRLQTPIYFREGTIIPMQEGVRTRNNNDLSKVEFHVFLNKESSASAKLEYSFDDGESFDYQHGHFSSLKATANVSGNKLIFTIDEWNNNFGPINFAVTSYDNFDSIEVLYQDKVINNSINSFDWEIGNKSLACQQSEWLTIE